MAKEIMKKRLIMMIAIIVGIVCLSSCTKVKEKNFVGTWRVISFQVSEGYGWYEQMEDGENRTITFGENGTYVDHADGYSDVGTWAYLSYSGQLRLWGVLWDVNFYKKDEIELSREDYDPDDELYFERVFLKKIS